MSLICPHCLSKTLVIRSSSQECPTLNSIWVQCQNLDCGFTGKGYTEITHETSPSAIPNPSIQLKPTSKRNIAIVA